ERAACGARAARRYREEVRRHGLALAAQMVCELRLDAPCDPERAALAGDLCKLRIPHFAKGFLALAAEQVVAAEVGAAGGGQHLAHEDRLELLRSRGEALARAASRRRAGERRGGTWENRRGHITTISALSEPACLSASRIATRS